jgi:hypothetical protein
MDLAPRARAALTAAIGGVLTITGSTIAFGPLALVAAGVVLLTLGVVGLVVLGGES